MNRNTLYASAHIHVTTYIICMAKHSWEFEHYMPQRTFMH